MEKKGQPYVGIRRKVWESPKSIEFTFEYQFDIWSKILAKPFESCQIFTKSQLTHGEQKVIR